MVMMWYFFRKHIRLHRLPICVNQVCVWRCTKKLYAYGAVTSLEVIGSEFRQQECVRWSKRHQRARRTITGKRISRWVGRLEIASHIELTTRFKDVFYRNSKVERLLTETTHWWTSPAGCATLTASCIQLKGKHWEETRRIITRRHHWASWGPNSLGKPCCGGS